jgi:hypothetical protein
MTVDLHKLADEVTDEKSFLAFLDALAADWGDEQAKEAKTPSSPYGPGANGWEHGSIGAFLGAAAGWGAASINGLKFYQKPDNPWRRAAQILYMGKIYE